MDELIENLKDAGCDPEQTLELCRLYESGDFRVVLQKLRRHRCDLMDKLHESQREVDCLDFLLRKVEKIIKVTV